MKVFSTRVITDLGVRLMQEAGIGVNQWEETRELSPEELISKCRQHDALIVAGPIKVDGQLLEACQHLKVIAVHGVGYDNIDLSAANRFGIPIGNTPYVVDEATAETAFMLMLMVARKALYQHKRILKGDWSFFEPTAHLGIELKGKTLGIFGLGNIGYRMAGLCRAAYDMKIIYCNRSRNFKAEQELRAEKVSFDKLLKESDVLSVHSVLSNETRGVFNREAFSAMKPSSIFINTARGAIHNEEDLTEVLIKNQIWGAGLDVTNPEPMDPDSPLLKLDNATILPHIGTSTQETREKMVRRVAENIIAGLKGERLPYVVNKEVYD
ncbi:2-hydroxyacid dehydrogenase [Desertivirga brevis]|uniref:2-hydroxyacid dehydrogenase n=1 Tax=Desertivirga brevis TaxID=2810310 RepID=UPI001A96C779|nr:D-glycerate dehydrogenase [Pedobacter sp. SYSU D00873]